MPVRAIRCLLPALLSIGSTAAPVLAAPADRPPPAEVVATVTQELREAGVTGAQIARARRLYRPVSLTGAEAQDWLVDMRAAPSGMLCEIGRAHV